MLDKNELEKFNRTHNSLIKRIIDYDLQEPSYCQELLASLEKETVYLRQLISTYSNPLWRRYIFSENDYEIAIKSEQLNGQIRYILELPFLLANRRSSLTNFKRTIVSDTHMSILEYCRENNPPMIENASVTFINFYAPSVNRKLRHDNDNTEISSILNALTGFLIPDDSCMCCDIHILSREAERSHTKVIVEERKDTDEQ